MKMYQYLSDTGKIGTCEKIDDFINSWEQFYWLTDGAKTTKNTIKISKDVFDGEKSITKVKSVSINATCKFVETYQGEDIKIRTIETILNEGIKDALDVEEILAWKIGKINMLETQEKKELVFDKSQTNPNGWVRSSDPNDLKNTGMVLGGFGRKINLEKICRDIVSAKGDIKPFENYESEGVEKFFTQHYEDEIKRKDVYGGIGLVYLITLLHFLTRGGVPIYDRFVHIALEAIVLEKQPGDCVSYVAPAASDYEAYVSLMDEYISLMKSTIVPLGRTLYREDEGTDIAQIRTMDRALWVYGHLFNLR